MENSIKIMKTFSSLKKDEILKNNNYYSNLRAKSSRINKNNQKTRKIINSSDKRHKERIFIENFLKSKKYSKGNNLNKTNLIKKFEIFLDKFQQYEFTINNKNEENNIDNFLKEFEKTFDLSTNDFLRKFLLIYEVRLNNNNIF